MFTVDPPAKLATKSQPVGVRIARSVANLFGVIYSESDYDLTWVSELSRTSLIEVAQGSPKGVNDARIPQEGQVRAISPTSLQAYGQQTDTLAGVVLAGSNTLYLQISKDIQRALGILSIAHPEGPDADAEPVATTLRLQTAAALVMEAYAAAPALFLAASEARSRQRRFFADDRRVQYCATAKERTAECEIRPGMALGTAIPDRSRFEFDIVDSIIRALRLDQANAAPIIEAPAWSGVAGTIASKLIETIQRIGSLEGRGVLRIVEPAPKHRTMQAFFPTSAIAYAFSEDVKAWIHDDGPHQDALPKVLANFKPEVLKEASDTVISATGIAFLWMTRLYLEWHKPSDSDYVSLRNSVKRMLAYLTERRFEIIDPTLVSMIRIENAKIVLVGLRRQFKPDDSITTVHEDAGSIENAVNELITLMATARLSNVIDEARLLDVIYHGNEALNGMRRDLAESTLEHHHRLRERITDALTESWIQFFKIAQRWDPNAALPSSDTESMGKVTTGEFAHLTHNYGSFLAFDERKPENLADASALFRLVVLPARNYTPGRPDSAAFAVPRPHQLEYSLEVASRADAALALLYKSVAFEKKANTHASHALEYARAVSSMPAVNERLRESMASVSEASVARTPDYHAAATAVNLATAYLTAEEVLGEGTLAEVDEESLKRAITIAQGWATHKEGSGTALAHTFATLIKNHGNLQIIQRILNKSETRTTKRNP